MGLLFAFFLIGLPLAAGVAELMMMTGQIKKDVWSSRIGGYTPRLAAAPVGQPMAAAEPVVAPAMPVPATEPAPSPDAPLV